MKYTSIDKVVRGFLLQRRWPIHFYVECIAYAQRCFAELHFDTLKNVRTVPLSLNSYGAAQLPCDYMDYCKIGVMAGNMIRPIYQRQGINRLNNIDQATGQKVPYPSDDSNYMYSSWAKGNFSWFNDRGEFTGRMYGMTATPGAGFKILPERGEIQLEGCAGTNIIVMEYISDGSECDNATMVSPYAISAIEAFMLWKYKENSRSYSPGEREVAKREWIRQHDILRGRLNDLTTEDIKQSYRRHTHGSLKG